MTNKKKLENNLEETELVRRAKEIHLREAQKGSYYGDRFPIYDERRREQLSKKNGIDPKKVYGSLGTEDLRFILARRIIEAGLNKEDVRNTIEYYFKNNYGPTDYFTKKNPEGTKELIKKLYPEWCEYFRIEPRKDFPDWIKDKR